MAASLLSLIGSTIKSFTKNKKENTPQPKSRFVGFNNDIKPNSTSSSIIVRPSSALVPKISKSSKVADTNNILLSIKNKVLEIENIVTTNSLLRKKAQEKQRIEKEQTRFKKEEDRLEKGTKLPNFNIPIPGKGIFDNIMSRLFTFFGFIFLGKVFPLLIKTLPILQGIVNTIGKIGSFFENIFGTLLNGFMSFVEWGFRVRDGIENIGTSIVGSGFEKTLSDFENKFSTFMNLALIAGMATIGVNNSEKPQNKIKGPKGTPGRSRTGVNSYAARRYADRYGKDAAIRRFGQESVKSLGGKYGRSGVTNLARKGAVGVLGKSGAKAALKIIKPIVKTVPVIGGLIDFGLSWALGDPVGKAAFRGVGTALLGALGAAIGGPFGMFLGGWAGSETGGALYDVIFNGKKSKGVAAKARGGIVHTRGGKRVGGKIRRSLPSKKTIKKPNPVKIQLIPGKDIGGENKIYDLYRAYDLNGGIGGSTSISKQFGDYLDLIGWTKGIGGKKIDPNSPYGVLSRISNIFKKIPFIGNIMGSAIDIALGQRPPERLYQNYADNLGYFISNLVQNKVASSTTKIFGLLSKMDSGGKVYPTVSTIQDIQKDLDTKDISTTIGVIVKSDIEKAIKVVKDASNIQLAKLQEEGGGNQFPGENYPGSGITVEDIQGVSGSEKELLLRLMIAEAGGQGEIGLALVARSILNRSALIQSGKVSPGTFLSNSGSIHDVINGDGQYTPVRQGKLKRPLTKSEYEKANAALALALDGNKLRSKLKSEGYNDSQINNFLSATGFRTPSAKYDASQDVNPIQHKGHIFNTAGNRSMIIPGMPSSTISENHQIFSGSGTSYQGGAIITQYNDPDNQHSGMDIALKSSDGGYNTGAKIPVPVDKLTINGSGYDFKGGKGFGNWISGTFKGKDGKTYELLVGHLRDIPPYKKGTVLRKGQTLGIQGTSGSASGPHVTTHVNSKESGGNPWAVLREEIIKPWQTGWKASPVTLAKKGGKEGVIVYEDGKKVWKPRSWTEDERKRIETSSQTTAPISQTPVPSVPNVSDLSKQFRFKGGGHIPSGKDISNFAGYENPMVNNVLIPIPVLQPVLQNNKTQASVPVGNAFIPKSNISKQKAIHFRT